MKYIKKLQDKFDSDDYGSVIEQFKSYKLKGTQQKIPRKDQSA